MSELDDIRRKKLEQLQKQQAMAANQQVQQQQQQMQQAQQQQELQAQLNQAMKQIMTPEARSRLANLKLTKPDLIIVDGGIGQVKVAREVINELNMNIPVVGLKKNDKHSTEELVGNDPIEIINIDKKSNLFLLLTKMQDEVHNYTISYHKQIRSKGALSSILDNINGIGEKRKKELLKKYKTINKMKEATLEELKEILPSDVANNFYEFLKEYK